MTTYHIGNVPVPADVFAILTTTYILDPEVQLTHEQKSDVEYAEAKYQQLKAEWEADEHKYDCLTIDVYPGKWHRTALGVTTEVQGYIVEVRDKHERLVSQDMAEDHQQATHIASELQQEYGVKWIGNWPEDNYW
jgi:hypothetical protein